MVVESNLMAVKDVIEDLGIELSGFGFDLLFNKFTFFTVYSVFRIVVTDLRNRRFFRSIF